MLTSEPTSVSARMLFTNALAAEHLLTGEVSIDSPIPTPPGTVLTGARHDHSDYHHQHNPARNHGCGLKQPAERRAKSETPHPRVAGATARPAAAAPA